MNNLKRVFSLALATVMVIGMMVVGASATDFVDDGDITNRAAVETMTALGIINGIDGAFKPNGMVTRAQMAQMIAKSLNGGKLPEFGLATKGTFSDVPATFWGAEAIEYCASLHIVGGYGDGTFKPNQNVTGQEAAKMMLVAMGYDEGIFGFTGANWAANVDYYADNLTTGGDYDKEGDDTTSVSMYAGVDARALPLTRDAAAQLIYNGLNANTVSSKVIGVQNGAPLYEYNMYNKPLLVSKFNATVAVVKLTKSAYAAKTGTYTYTVSDPDKVLTKVETTQDVTEAYQQGIRVVYTGSGKTMKVLAVSAVAPTTVNAIVDAEFDLDETTKKIVSLDGNECTSSVDVYVFNADTKLTAAITDAAKGFDTSKVNAWDTYSLILDSEGKVTTVIVYPTTVEQVTDVKNGVVSTKLVSNGTTTATYTIENDKPEKVDATTEDELAKGDYVLVSKANNLPAKLAKQSVIENVTATAESDGVYTIGGQKYQLVNNQTIATSGETSELGKDFNLVVVNGLVVVAARADGEKGTSIDLSSVLYAAEIGAIVNGASNEMGEAAKVNKVRAVFTDGTSKVIDVAYLGVKGGSGADKDDPKPVDTTKAVADKLYTFTEKDGLYALVELSASEKLNFADRVNTVTAITAGGKAGSTRFASDAVLFVKYNDGKDVVVEVMSGADINGWKSNATVTSDLFTNVNTSTRLSTVGFGVITVMSGSSVGTLPGAQDQVGNYGYLLTGLTNVWNPDAKATQKQVTLWDGENEVTYFVANSVSMKKGDAIEFTLKDNVITAATVLTGNDEAVYAYDGETIYFAGAKNTAYTVTSDTVLIYIDSTKVEGQTSGNIVLANTKEENDSAYVSNVYYKEGSDKKISVLFVDVNNAIKVSE